MTASAQSSVDPSLGALADAILIPPFAGTTAPPWVLSALERGLAGVTLFGPNVAGDTPSLTASLRGAAPGEPVIAIDEEGGDVTRVAYASGSPYPGNLALGAVDDVALTTAVYAAIGADLARLGINVNLSPCVDVLSLDGSAVVGTRSFGADTSLVARHSAAAVSGLQSAGVAACAKHFPGHGSTIGDSHLTLPAVRGTMDEIRARDLPPFLAAMDAGTVAIMPGHLVVPALTGDTPASLSAAAVTGLLRGELGFDGVVISDGLEMKAASAVHGIPEASVLAVIAGVDLLCLGRDTDEAMYHAVRAAIADAVKSGRLPGSRLEEAAARIGGLRVRLAGARAAAQAGAGGDASGGRCDDRGRFRRRSSTRSSSSSSRRRTSPPGASLGASTRGRPRCGLTRRPETGPGPGPSSRQLLGGPSCWPSGTRDACCLWCRRCWRRGPTRSSSRWAYRPGRRHREPRTWRPTAPPASAPRRQRRRLGWRDNRPAGRTPGAGW
jgi:beta-glucosidase-like glycosyl hydrolase